MASTNKTENLNLSQFIGEDRPSWLTDYNNDMLAIDEKVAEIVEASDLTFQPREDEALETNASNMVEAINEVHEEAGKICGMTPIVILNKTLNNNGFGFYYLEIGTNEATTVIFNSTQQEDLYAPYYNGYGMWYVVSAKGANAPATIKGNLLYFK